MRLLSVFAGLLVIGATSSTQAQDPLKNPRTVCTKQFLSQRLASGRTVVETFTNEKAGWACLQIRTGNRIVFRRTSDNDAAFKVGQKADAENGLPPLPDIATLTNLGEPDVLVSEWTGGAHCCRVDRVFALAPRPRLVGTIKAADGDLSYFDRGQDGTYLYHGADWTFDYWFGSFAGSPQAPIVLRFRGGGFHLALDRMVKPAPSAEEWNRLLGIIRSDVAKKGNNEAEDLRTDLWEPVMQLIYTRHEDLAWKLVQEAGADAQGGSDPTLQDFCSTLKASPYWVDLQPWLLHMPAACRAASRAR